MSNVLDLVTPVILRVDAAGDIQPADEASAMWLEAQEVAGLAGPVDAWDRSLLRLCGTADVTMLVDADGPWRAVALPSGEYLVVGAMWQGSDTIAMRVGAETLQNKQALLNVLPATASEGLSGRSLQPKAYRESTILFVDAVQFSRLAARVDPVSCIKQLDFYFSLFDQITGAFAVEKVTTIGDTYLAVAGVPQRRAAHAVDATLAALRLAQAVATRPGPVVDEWEWSFRIGLHSGPCISGVLGARKHVFDLWGDTVSVAAHVQRVGRPDVVSVSGVTAALIEPFFEVVFDGTTVVRNAGEVEIYVVRGVRPELADERTGLVNAAFRAKYVAMFGDECPASASDPMLGAL